MLDIDCKLVWKYPWDDVLTAILKSSFPSHFGWRSCLPHCYSSAVLCPWRSLSLRPGTLPLLSQWIRLQGSGWMLLSLKMSQSSALWPPLSAPIPPKRMASWAGKHWCSPCSSFSPPSSVPTTSSSLQLRGAFGFDSQLNTDGTVKATSVFSHLQISLSLTFLNLETIYWRWWCCKMGESCVLMSLLGFVQTRNSTFSPISFIQSVLNTIHSIS